MIHVRNLSFTYEGAASQTLHGLTFDVADGEIFGFLGPSGSGKSTTQKVLYGLLRDYTGEVQVLGRDIRGWGAELYEQIGVSFELPNHYSALTALENLEYFQRLHEDTLDLSVVLGWLGLQDDGDTRVSAFSKGMKVRLNLARSLLHKPKLLFLDEPTAGLDPTNARNVMNLLCRLRDEGTTIFLTTHNMTVADELCDRVAFLTKGAIGTIDTPEALKREHGRRSCVVVHSSDGQETSSEFALDGLGQNADFRRLLDAGERIESIHSQETTLDRIFIEVTGEGLDNT